MNTDAAIPFLDLVTPHVELEEELMSLFRRVLHTAGFIGGPMVENFETAFAEFCETRHAVAVNSGTDALRFAIMASGVQAGDVVLTVPNTFIATTEAISQARAIPEFIDVNEQTYNMSVAMLQRYLQKMCVRDKTGRLISLRSGRPVAAIIPVHLYGQMADMDAILEIAEQYNLIVIEDACQAHGAEYFSKRTKRWMKAGSMGHAAAFSFYPGKNLGACGEAGAITTNDSSMAEKTRMLRDHGQSRKYFHDLEGYNGRLDALQAGILLTKLGHLRSWNEQRRMKAAEYKQLLSGCHAVGLPFEPSWSRAVYHLFVIRSNDREGLMKHLAECGIGSAIHYPVSLHLQRAYVSLNYSAGDFPVSESAAAEIVSLPMYPQLTLQQQERVVREVVSFCMNCQSKPTRTEVGSLVSAEPMV